MWEKHYTPPPPNHPHIWDTKSEQGNTGYNEGALFKKKFLKIAYKKKSTPPPPPPRIYIFFDTNFFFNVGNSMKREENLK